MKRRKTISKCSQNWKPRENLGFSEKQFSTVCGKHCWKLESAWNCYTFSCGKTLWVFNRPHFPHPEPNLVLLHFHAKKLEIIFDFPTDFFTDNQQGKIFPEKIPKLSFSTSRSFKNFPKHEKVKKFYTNGENFPKDFGQGYSHSEIRDFQGHLLFFAPFQSFDTL